jgi:hypothetical protein
MRRKTAVLFLGAFLSNAWSCTSQSDDLRCAFSTDPEDPSPIFWYIQSFTTRWLEAPPAPDGSEGFVNVVGWTTTLKNILLGERLATCSGSFRLGGHGPSGSATCELNGESAKDSPVVSANVTQIQSGISLEMMQMWDCKDKGFVRFLSLTAVGAYADERLHRRISFAGKGSTVFEEFLCGYPGRDPDHVKGIERGDCWSNDIEQAGEITIWGAVSVVPSNSK